MRRAVNISIVLSIIFVMGIYGQNDLVGYWSFDEPEGEVFFDRSQFNNHGKIIGAEIIPGLKGNALYFDGVDDFATISGENENPPEVLKDLGSGSISLWFRVDHIPPENGIAPVLYYGAAEKCDFFDASNQGLIIEVGHSPVHYRSERLYFTLWKNGCGLPSFCYDSNDPIETGEWYHFVVIVGENYNTGYLNGKEMTNRRYNFGNSSYSQFFEDAVVHERLWLGKGFWDRNPQYFEGAIDEIKIYDRVLSDGEIKTLYESPGEPLGRFPAKNNDYDVKTYPNPAGDHVNFDLRNIEKKINGVKIINSSGKLYSDQPISYKTGILNLNDLPGGIYYLDFYGEGINLREKVTVRR